MCPFFFFFFFSFSFFFFFIIHKVTHAPCQIVELNQLILASERLRVLRGTSIFFGKKH